MYCSVHLNILCVQILEKINKLFLVKKSVEGECFFKNSKKCGLRAVLKISRSYTYTYGQVKLERVVNDTFFDSLRL